MTGERHISCDMTDENDKRSLRPSTRNNNRRPIFQSSQGCRRLRRHVGHTHRVDIETHMLQADDDRGKRITQRRETAQHASRARGPYSFAHVLTSVCPSFAVNSGHAFPRGPSTWLLIARDVMPSISHPIQFMAKRLDQRIRRSTDFIEFPVHGTQNQRLGKQIAASQHKS